MFDFLKKILKVAETQTRSTSTLREGSQTRSTSTPKVESQTRSAGTLRVEIQTRHTVTQKTDTAVVKKHAETSATIDLQAEIVALWLLSQKKKPTVDTFSIPKKVQDRYNFNTNTVIEHLLTKKLITNDNGMLSVTESGLSRIREYSCCVIIHQYPEFKLTEKDFTENPNWHKIKDNDIIWGIFNSRILEYTKTKMWTSLMTNYENMAKLLIGEAKHEKALDFVFAAAFLNTSGMLNENIVTVYGVEINNRSITVPLVEISKKLELNVEDLRKKYRESQLVLSLSEILPFYYYNIEEACEFMLEAFTCGEKKGIFTEGMLKRKLKKNTPNKNETSRYFYNSIENIMKKQFD